MARLQQVTVETSTRVVNQMSHLTGIILAGGASQRMGQDKASLPWGTSTVLEHLVSRFSQRLSPLIVAGPTGLMSITLPGEVLLAHDPSPHQGPLAGFLNGLNHAPEGQDIFLMGCDFPLLTTSVVDFLQSRLNDADAVVPQSHSVLQPLVGLFRAGIKKDVQKLFDQGKRSMHALLNTIKVEVINEDEWRKLDPMGRLLININTREEYLAAHEAYLASLSG